MQPFETIVCAADLSDRSERAITRAVAIARQHAAGLEIVHIVDREQPAALQARQQEVASQRLAEILGRVGQATTTAPRVHVLVGDPIGGVTDLVGDRGRTLLVLGAPRRHERLWPFSSHTAGKLLRAARVPVVVAIRSGADPWQNVLTAVDWSAHSRRAVALALAMAPTARHRLLHAWHVPFEGLQPGERPRREYAELSEREMLQFVDTDLADTLASARRQSPGIVIETAHRMGNPQVAIRDEAAANPPDLVVLGTRGGSGLRRAFLGSVAEDILSDPPADVLVVSGR